MGSEMCIRDRFLNILFLYQGEDSIFVLVLAFEKFFCKIFCTCVFYSENEFSTNLYANQAIRDSIGTPLYRNLGYPGASVNVQALSFWVLLF